jgi:inosine-uridine nucleoside N-ribohydrolase
MVPFEFPDYWPEPIAPRPSSPGRALELLAENAEAGATVVAIGPYTNLALLEAARPGLLRSSGVVVMGGHVPPPRPGLPPLGAHDDFNIQQDAPAAHVVLERCDPLVVPLAVTMTVSVRAAHVPRLRQAGPLGGLLADQADAYARDKDRLGLARRFEGLPDDLLNFQHDPLACAVAAGWDGAVIEHTPTALEVRDRRLWMIPRADAPALRVVTAVDAPRFEEAWLEAVERASSRLAPS